MNLQPLLENDLIRIRPLSECDFEPLYEIAKDPLIWEQHPSQNRYQRDVYAEFFKDSCESGGALIVIDKKTDEIIGSTRFKTLDDVENAIEIGWSFLSRKYWGGEFNQSIKKQMLDYAFKFVDNVVFYVGKENVRSQKAVEKIGGTKITEESHPLLAKKSRNDWTYRINRQQWENM